MLKVFSKGETRRYEVKVIPSDFAGFEEGGTVHEVYSTFALARDAEWSGRLFVLEMKEAHEEGIGSAITIEHLAPAFEGEEVMITSTYEALKGNRVLTSWEAKVGERIIAKGTQEQRIVDKEKLDRHFDSFKA